MVAPTETVEGFRLSPQQAAAWRYRQQSHAGTIDCRLSITGPVDPDRLRRALELVVDRHDVLRTRFHQISGMPEPLQVIADTMPPDWHTDARGESADDPPAEGDPVDPARGPMLRARLVHSGSGEAELRLSLPALVADEQSMVNLVADLCDVYRGIGGPQVRPVAVQYLSFAAWLGQVLRSAEPDATRYWQDVVDRSAAPLRLGYRPATAEPAALEQITVAAEVDAGAVDVLAARLGSDPSTVLLAAWAAVLHRLGGASEIVVNHVVDGRRFAELHDALGPFATPLPVPVQAADEVRFDDFAATIGRIVTRHRDVAEYGVAVVTAADLDRPGGQAAFHYVEHAPDFVAGDVAFAVTRLHSTAWPAAVRLSCRRWETGLALQMSSDPARFSRAYLERLLDSYTALVTDAARRPETRLDELEVLGSVQRAAVLRLGRGPSPSGAAGTVPDLIAKRAAETPSAVAVRQGDTVVTYAELIGCAADVANRLLELGLRPEDRVALLLDRSVDAVVGLLGILRAGATYVPVDPTDPPGRVRYILDDAAVTAVVTATPMAARQLTAVPVVDIATCTGVTVAHDEVTGHVTPANAAYVCYTSGSTGRPKGVVVEHGNLLTYLRWVNEVLVGDRVLPAVTRFAFDASLKQVLGPLIRGGEVWLLPAEVVGDPGRLCGALTTRSHIAVNCVPSLWQALLDAVQSGGAPDPAGRIERLLLGGAPLSASLVERTTGHFPTTEMWNLYGPTEATANATAGPVGPSGPVLIGQPIGGAEAYVLDRFLRPVPVGAPGRLYVGGTGVSRGYLGRPAETAAAFVPHPFTDRPGSRLYDTGDLARYHDDGSIEFLGRRDLQVKVRGHRIELEGVEALLREIPDVADAAVAVRRSAGGDDTLVAYIEPAAGAAPSEQALRGRLADNLPARLLPSGFITVGALPRNATGKLDRRALDDIETAPSEPPPSGPDATTRPADAVEDLITALWSGLLDGVEVGRDDNLFALGAHSLLVIRFVARLHEVLGVTVEPHVLFEAPTVRGFAARVAGALAGPAWAVPRLDEVVRPDPLPLSYPQQRLWILNRLEPDNPRYNVQAARLIRGRVELDAIRDSVDALVRRHEVLRTTFAWDGAGEPYQVIHPQATVPVEVVDLTTVATAEQPARIREYASTQVRRPFDLTRLPLLRVSVLRTGEREAVLLIVVHHIVCDGWAKAVLFAELAAFHRASVAGTLPDLAPLDIQYADFAVWQRGWMTGEVLERQLSYWRERLHGLPVLDLPTDRPRSVSAAHRGGNAAATLSRPLADALRHLSTAHDATLFMATFAAFTVVLGRYAGADDVVVGTPIANRDRSETERLIGFFVNTVALRADLSGDPTFVELLRRVRREVLAAFVNQDVPFEKVVEELQPERDPSRSPVFQVMFVFVPAAEPEVSLGADATLHLYGLDPDAAMFDLTLSVLLEPDGLALHLNYDRELFDADTADGMLADLTRIIEGAVAGPRLPISRLPMLAPGEAERLIASWRGLPEPVDRTCLHRLVEAQVERTPHAEALIGDGVRLTYRELDVATGRMAGRLAAAGVAPGDRVVICTPPAAALVVGLLAVAKAGGVAVPVADTEPDSWRSAVIAAAAPAAVLARASSTDRLGGWTGPVLSLDDDHAPDAAPPARRVSADAYAHIWYRPDASDAPAGVLTSHAAIGTEVRALQRSAGLSAADVVLLGTEVATRGVVRDIVWPLSVGARLVVVDPGRRHDATHVADRSRRHGVTRIGAAGVHEWAETGAVLVGTCSPDALDGPIPMRPTGAGEIHLLDRHGQPVPPRAVGRMYVGGACLAAGYTGHAGHPGGAVSWAAATAERFVPDPGSGRPGARLFDTGILARHHPDGTISIVQDIEDRPPRLRRTAGGGIDVGALHGSDSGRAGSPSVGPRDRVETELLRIWQSVLGKEQIAVTDHFFELGGHSLAMLRMLSRIREAFDVELSAMAPIESPRLVDLAERVRAALDPAAASPVGAMGAVVSDAGTAPLSFVQQRFWITERLAPDHALNHVVDGWRIVGDVDVDDVRRAVGHIVRRHDVLRTAFREVAGAPVAAVLADVDVPVEVVDLTAVPADRRSTALREHMSTVEEVRFDLSRPPLLRVVLFRLRTQEWALLVLIHHIVCDAWSLELFFAEFTAGYQAYRAGQRPRPAPLPARYADFAAWQRSRLDTDEGRRQLEYWRTALHRLPALLLPTDRARPSHPSYRGGRVHAHLPARHRDRLAAYAAARNATLFMAVAAAYAATLGRYAGQPDFGVAIPITNRTRTEFEAVIGCFVNTLILRADLTGDPTFTDLLDRIRRTAAGAYANQEFPFDKLVEELRPARDRARSPFAQVMLTFMSTGEPAVSVPDAVLEPLEFDGSTTTFDLRLLVRDEPDGLHLVLIYDRDLFETGTAERVLEYLRRLFVGVAADPDRLLSELAGLDADDRSAVVRPPSADRGPGSGERPGATAHQHVHELIAAQVEAHPDAVAVVCRGQTLTYRQLGERSDRVARYLRARGIADEQLVGVYLDRSVELVVALLGVLKAGAAYLPLDPAYPTGRNRYVLSVARPAAVLTTGKQVAALSADGAGWTGPDLITVERCESEIVPGDPAELPVTPAHPDALAYVIFTSGSTGRPKGVMVSHRNLTRSTRARFAYYWKPVTGFLLASSVAFDSSVAGLFWTLCSGGSLILPGGAADLEPRRLATLAHQQGASHLLAVPSLYAGMLAAAPERLAALRVAIVAGEQVLAGLPVEHHRRLPRTELHNEYGVTEASVWSTVHHCRPDDDRPVVPIGHPIVGTGRYLLDRHLAPVPVGAVGELFLAGDGISRGYLDRADLTADRFWPDPFGTARGGRMYRTGDLARSLPDGSVVLIGRVDDQLNVNGYRIEPAEIEAAIVGLFGISAAVVVPSDGAAGLGAYLLVPSAEPVPEPKLRQALRRRLPDHLVPTVFRTLDAFPLTPNGKVDRRTLGPLRRAEPTAGPATAEQSPSGTIVEEALTAIWRELFGRPDLGRDADFFALGGHSLQALALLSRIGDVFGVELPLSIVFDAPTVAELADALAAAMTARGDDVTLSRSAAIPIDAFGEGGDRNAPGSPR